MFSLHFAETKKIFCTHLCKMEYLSTSAFKDSTRNIYYGAWRSYAGHTIVHTAVETGGEEFCILYVLFYELFSD